MKHALDLHRDFWPNWNSVWSLTPRLDSLVDEMVGFFGQSPSNVSFVPAVDVVEKGDQTLFRFDLPGMEKDDIRIEIQDGTLTVSGQRKSEKTEEKDGYRHVERSFGSFSRSFQLPQGTEMDKVEAEYQAGVLTVTLPKGESKSSRRIPIGNKN